MTVCADNTEVMIINYDDKQVDILHDEDEYTHANDHLCNLCTLRPKYLDQISENWYSKQLTYKRNMISCNIFNPLWTGIK